MATSICSDTSEALELFEPQGLFLKPIAKLNVSVQLPQMKTPGKSISNWEVMEKIKHMVRPHTFITLKVVKSTLEFLRFEGEIENKTLIPTLVAKLDSKFIKLSGFPDSLKVRSAEAKINFPTRHDWDSYFRDAKNMNEMKPGERPDTIHFRDLPTKWFVNKKDQERDKLDKPSEYILKKVFETFGEIRCVDIPMLDPYRKEMTKSQPVASGVIQTFSFGQDLTFEAYVQYKEYIGFVKAMNALKGMKLLYKGEEGKAYTANMKVDFDKSKHLTDKAIRKRRLERERLEQLEREREDRVRKEREEIERKLEEERRKKEEEERDRERKRLEKERLRRERREEREAKRRAKRLEKRRKQEEKEMQMKIALEERKILIAQRKLETIRLLSELFKRVKVRQQEIRQKEEVEQRERELEEERLRQLEQEKEEKIQKEKKKLGMELKRKERLQRQEHELRNKILKNLRTVEERKAEQVREELRKKVSGTTRLKSAIVMKK